MTIAGILLAAGRGSRFGAQSKLMADLGGRPVVDWAAAAMELARIAPRIAVVRPGDHEIKALLEARGFLVVENARTDEGMGTSIATGVIWAAEFDVDGALVALGDMPFVRPETFERLAMTVSEAGPDAIAVAVGEGRRSAPVAFGGSYLKALAELSGDEGGRAILAANRAMTIEAACAPGELDDVDTEEALEAARRRASN